MPQLGWGIMASVGEVQDGCLEELVQRTALAVA